MSIPINRHYYSVRVLITGKYMGYEILTENMQVICQTEQGTGEVWVLVLGDGPPGRILVNTLCEYSSTR